MLLQEKFKDRLLCDQRQLGLVQYLRMTAYSFVVDGEICTTAKDKFIRPAIRPENGHIGNDNTPSRLLMTAKYMLRAEVPKTSHMHNTYSVPVLVPVPSRLVSYGHRKSSSSYGTQRLPTYVVLVWYADGGEVGVFYQDSQHYISNLQVPFAS